MLFRSEEQLDRMQGVRESCVIGLPHPDLGEAVTAIIVPEAGSDSAATITVESVASFLTDRLARFKQPRQVVLVETLPRNAMGKVQKKALREEYAGLFN